MLFDAQWVQVDVDALRDREKDAVKRGLLDNYDDVEGYYNFQVRASCLVRPLFWQPLPDELQLGLGIIAYRTLLPRTTFWPTALLA